MPTAKASATAVGPALLPKYPGWGARAVHPTREGRTMLTGNLGEW